MQPPNASEPLAFRNVRAGLTVFPRHILDADIAGGELNATVIPSSLWNPERLAVRSSLSGVGIEPLLRPFMGKTSLVQIRSGKLEGSATLDLPLLNGRPEPLAGEGSLNLSLRGGVADLSLPMLKSSRLDKLEGTVETGWKRDRLTLHQLAVRSPMLACTVQGQVTLVPRDLPASRMDVQSSLSEQVREELMPERTQSLKVKGEVGYASGYLPTSLLTCSPDRRQDLKDSFIILQSGTELTGALCRVGLKAARFRICTTSPAPI
ncbi:MAG: hypothetical protein ACLR7Z_15505 [Bilophila wadsworthia]